MASADAKPIVFRDFTGGLWDRGDDRECPPNGLLECTDAYPLQAGGVRAAMVLTADTRTGLPSNKRMCGYFHAARSRTANLFAFDLLLLTTNDKTTVQASSQNLELWNSITSSTSWTTAFSRFTAANPPPMVNFVDYTYNSGGTPLTQTAFGFNGMSTGADDGVWFANGVGGVGNVTTISAGYVQTHQDRLVFTNNFWNFFSRIYFFNELSSLIASTASYIDVAMNKVGDIDWMESYYPNDLFLAKGQQGMFSAQGTFPEPSISQGTAAHASKVKTWGTQTPYGLCYMALGEGVFAVNGSNAQHISSSIAGSPFMTEHVFQNNISGPPFYGGVGFNVWWLFTPTGFVYDFRTRAWFKLSLPSGMSYIPFWSKDEINPRIWGAGEASTGQATVVYADLNEDTMARATSYAITLPVFDLDERTVEPREIEIHGEAFGNGGSYTITLDPAPSTPPGQPPTYNVTTSGPFVALFLVGVNSSVVKIRIQADGKLGSEAPMIERVVVKVQAKQKRPS